MSEKKLTLAIVDDHPIVIEGLRSLFTSEPNIEEVHSFATGAALLAFLAGHNPDIVLLDIELPDGSGVDFCKKVKMIKPGTVVIGLSNKAERSTVVHLLQNGASGFLLKSAPAEDILNSIEVALRGEVVMGMEVRKIVFSSTDRQFPSLTKRERQLMKLLAEGKTTAIIAEELFLSRFTVDTYRKNLLQKFGVKNTTELVTLLLKEKLL
ncbi:response regulator transcription factor [Algoriphagus resistens]|uniref:response regulator transcription factor n=1 Tax=Algoriphagus resistens TaxID=1750590 RepID=UPI000716BA61|nr:response regulator transcription factor [Algoriphagus resistens]